MASVPRFSLADMTARDLADEMIRRIPAHTPEWKHVQTGDPGRVLIDLVAWMGETILYRVNLLPRRQRLEFLRLLGLKLRTATPACGLVALAHKKTAGAAPLFTPVGTRLNGPVPFETADPATVQPFEGRVYYKRRLEGDEADALKDVIDDLAELYGIDAADPYATTALFEDGKAIAAGTDPLTDSVDHALWIALLALDDKPTSREAAIAAFDVQPALLNIGVIPRLSAPASDPDAPAPGLAAHFEWAISSSKIAGGVAQDTYLPLQAASDNTGHMSREGTLRLVLPVAANVSAPVNDLEIDIDAGLGDRPPRVDDPTVSSRIVAWLRLTSKDTSSVLPISWLGINAVMLDAQETRRQIQVGMGNGRPAQQIKLPAGDVDESTFTLSVQEGAKGFVRWQVVDDLASLGRDDRGFTLDAADGSVAFGDGLAGRRPDPGAHIRVDFMRSGGGLAGNIPAGTLTAIEKPGLIASQPAAMTGGRMGETLEAAEMRVRAWLQHQDRCITVADYRAIASDLGLARVEVLPRFRPYQQRAETPGVVSVLPLPDKVVHEAPNPRPDRRLIEQVRAYLEPRRPLATELFVIAPDYVKIGVSAAIDIREGFAPEEVFRAVKAAIQDFFWPLKGGGRDGAGWPLGQSVNNLEAELVTARIAGVRSTAGAAIFTLQAPGFVPVPQNPATGAQVLELEPWQLPELMQVDIAVGPTVPTSMIDHAGTSGRGTAIPVVPEVC
ncbi:putative baseplate assembly protein [Microvirga pakistanensis]|uniref:putative baseplate assembly protein n=1 Tax=Microvirga pakistanensis TaxID=1682650 RepID=UPI00106B9E35|nr:putative baseplate assembly protein [Microvirga pakistanensis]